MKKLAYFAATLAALAGLFTSCDKTSQPSDEGGKKTDFELKASATDIVLEEKLATAEVLSLTWSAGSNQGTGSAITYKFEMAPAEAEWTSGYTEDLGRNIYSKAYKGVELNSLVKEKFEAENGVAAEYKIRVTAVVSGNEELNQSAEVKVRITPYEAVTTTLYMLGGAAKGWSLDSAPELTYSSAGVFTWTGRLNAGELKFVTQRTDFWPGYVRDGSDESGRKLKFFASQPSDAEDLKFEIAKAGTYNLRVDVLNLTFTYEESSADLPPYEQIYFVSDIDSWKFTPMHVDASDPYIFRHGFEASKECSFKFGTATGSWENMYKASVADAPTNSTEAVFVSGFEPDYKWKISADEAGKAYKVALNITPDKETMTCAEFTPYEALYLIGDAAPKGWSLDDAAKDDSCKMIKGEGKYEMTWTGELKNGELKISCELQRDWSGCWFMPCVADTAFDPVENSSISFVDSSEDGADRKWKVTAGNYTITVNQLLETITISKN